MQAYQKKEDEGKEKLEQKLDKILPEMMNSAEGGLDIPQTQADTTAKEPQTDVEPQV